MKISASQAVLPLFQALFLLLSWALSQVQPRTLFRVLFRVLLLTLCCIGISAQARAAEEKPHWLDVIRATPYWESRGVASNLATIRHWVLFGDSYCEEAQRHLLLDRRWRFLGYMNNTGSVAGNLTKLNTERQRLAEEERVPLWRAGNETQQGYPFALSCHQPYVDMPEAIVRLTGGDPDYRLWGTWDGMQIGAEDAPVSLITLFHAVYEYRAAQALFSFPDAMIPVFLGKIIIESGGQKNALSSQAARGILQLRPDVLADCRVPEAFQLHRIVQVDCALRLVEQNHRNLRGPFETVFGHLPEDKREALYALLLTQAYQIGVGRMLELLTDEELGRATAYFAEHHRDFSAEDILIGMIYHNIGRRDIGLLTLYYVTDASLALAALCQDPSMAEDPWCPAD